MSKCVTCGVEDEDESQDYVCVLCESAAYDADCEIEE